MQAWMLVLAMIPAQVDGAHSEVTVEPDQLRVDSRWVLSPQAVLPLRVPLVEPLEAALSAESEGLSAIRDLGGRLVAVEIGAAAGRYQRARLVVEPHFLVRRPGRGLSVPSPVSNLGHRVHVVAPWRFLPDEQGPLAVGLVSVAPPGFPERPLDDALAQADIRRPKAPLYLPTDALSEAIAPAGGFIPPITGPNASQVPGAFDNPGQMGPAAFLAFVLASGAAIVGQRLLARRSERDRADRALAAEIAAIDAEGLTDGAAEACANLGDGERSRATPMVPPGGLGQAHPADAELGPLVARGQRGLQPLPPRDPGAQEPHR